MNKLKYSIYVSAHNAYSNKKLLFIIILSYYIGLLMPFYCLANIEIFTNSLSTIEIVDSDKTYIVKLSASQGSKYDNYEEILSALNIKNCVTVVNFQGSMQTNNKAETVSVAGVDDGFESLERIEIIEGNFPPHKIPGAVTECVVSYPIAQRSCGWKFHES